MKQCTKPPRKIIQSKKYILNAKIQKKQTNEQATNYAQRISKMDAKCKCVTSTKKCRTNLVIASPKNQAITQGKRPTPNIKPKTKFSAKCGDRNPILRACCTHSHEPVQAEMAEGETGNLLHLSTRNVDFLKQKIRPIKIHQTNGKIQSKWRLRDPPHSNIHRHKLFWPQTGK